MPQTEHAGKPIRFPERTKFDEIFLDTAPWWAKHEIPPIKSYCWIDSEKLDPRWQSVGRYLSIREEGSHRALLVLDLSPSVLDYIDEGMIRVGYDSIYFEITIWDDGRALVAAKYNQIIGSHYLAIIDASTIPGYKAPACA